MATSIAGQTPNLEGAMTRGTNNVVNVASRFIHDGNIDPVAYWELEETSGTRADSANSNDFTDVNNVGSRAGVVGTAADFNGTDQLLIVNTSDVLFFGNSPFTYSVWFNLDALPGGGTSAVILRNKKANNSVGDNCSVSVSDAGDLTFQTWAQSGSFLTFNGFQTVIPGTWYHCVFRKTNASQWDCFVNGVNVATSTQTRSFTYTSVIQGISIGADDQGSNGQNSFTDGLIDEVAVFSTALSDADITSLYNGGAGRTYADTLANNIGTGNTLIVSRREPIAATAAITYADAYASAAASATSLTFSHTTSGSDRLLGVGFTVYGGPTDRVTSVTYNGVALTEINQITEPLNGAITHFYTLANPALGANDIVITLSSSALIEASSVSVQNATSPVLQASDTSNLIVADTSVSATVTTTTANAIVIGYVNNVNNTTYSAFGSGMNVAQTDNYTAFFLDPEATAGSKTASAATASAVRHTMCIAAYNT